MLHKSLLALAFVAAAPIAGADVLLIDGIETDAVTAAARPGRGMTMARVEASFGAPLNRHPAVGEPPITRWDYEDCVVYFEFDKVIHAVARHSLTAAAR